MQSKYLMPEKWWISPHQPQVEASQMLSKELHITCKSSIPRPIEKRGAIRYIWHWRAKIRLARHEAKVTVSNGPSGFLGINGLSEDKKQPVYQGSGRYRLPCLGFWRETTAYQPHSINLHLYLLYREMVVFVPTRDSHVASQGLRPKPSEEA